MGVTFTTALERDGRRERRLQQQPHLLDVALALASLLAVALLSAAYAGRFAWLPGPPAAPVDLNRVADARTLEPILAPLFESPGDGRLASRELFGYLVQAEGAPRGAPFPIARALPKSAIAPLARNDPRPRPWPC